MIFGRLRSPAFPTTFNILTEHNLSSATHVNFIQSKKKTKKYNPEEDLTLLYEIKINELLLYSDSRFWMIAGTVNDTSASVTILMNTSSNVV